jgi:zinc protease
MTITKHLIFLFLSVLLSVTGYGQDWKPDFEKFTLKNGLEVVLHRDTTLPLITLSMAYRAGSSTDTPGKTGIAQIAGEHLLLGTKKVPHDKLMQLRDEHNMAMQAQTGVDWVNLTTTAPMNMLESVIMIEADRLEQLYSNVTRESVANAVARLREEHTARKTKPLGILTQGIFKEIYGERHPYRHVTIGYEEHLDSIQWSDVRGFVRRNYNPANASLTVGGFFDAREVRTLLERYFGKIEAGQRRQWSQPPGAFSPIGQGGFIFEDNLRYNQLILVFPTIPLDHPDDAALRLLAQALAGSKEAILTRNLPTQNPTILSVEASQSSQEMTGTFWITVTCKMEARLQPVYDDVMRILGNISSSGIPEDDLVSARNHAAMRFYAPLESFYGFGGRCDILNLGNLLGGSPLFSINQFEATLAATSASLQRVATRYLTAENQLIVSVLPAGKSVQAVQLD